MLAALKRDAAGTPLTRALEAALPVAAARPARHVKVGHGASGASRLDVPGLFSLLVSLLRTRGSAEDDLGGAAGLLARHVVALCGERATTAEDGVVAPWVGAGDFGAYVEDRAGGSCCGEHRVGLAAPPAMRRFAAVADGLCRRGALVRYAGSGHAGVAVVARTRSGTRVYGSWLRPSRRGRLQY